MRTITAALLVLGTGAGCYASHQRGDPMDAGDAGGLDARAAMRDAGADAPPEPLPVEPEPDLGPDARPSDYPDAMDWVDPDPSSYRPDEPAVLPMGDAERLDFPGEGGWLVVDLEWDGRRWGLLYSDGSSAWFMPLQPLGSPDGARVNLGLRHESVGGMVWAGGRYLVALNTAEGDTPPPLLTATAGLIDRNGTRTSEWNVFAPAWDVTSARFVDRDQWVLAWLDSMEGTVVARVMGPDARWRSEPLALSDMQTASVRMVGLKSRVVLFRNGDIDGDARDDGVYAHVLRVPLGDDARISHRVFEGAAGTLLGEVARAPFRDVAIVADYQHSPVAFSQMRLAAFDPWDPATVTRSSVDIGSDHNRVGIPGVGADARSGLIALCYPVEVGGMGGPTQIRVHLFGPGLEQLGASATVGELDVRMPAAAGCEIAFSPSGILVAWWDRNQTEVWVRPLAPAGR